MNLLQADKTRVSKHTDTRSGNMVYDKATDPDAGLRLDFTSRKREGFMSSTGDSMRHEMQRMVDKINELEKRIIKLEEK